MVWVQPALSAHFFHNNSMQMKDFLMLLLLSGLLVFYGCKEEEEFKTLDPDYQINILSPDSSEKTAGELIHLKVEFNDKNGGAVHHVNIRVYNKENSEEIYNQPLSAHVLKASPFIFEDDLKLEVNPQTDWLLEARVWGHEAGLAETSAKVEFHVK